MVERTNIILKPDPTRVLIRYFSPGSPERIERITSRILTLNPEKTRKRLELVCRRFASRHHDVEKVFLRHYETVEPFMVMDADLSHDQKMLIGAYFTSEYALESAALFNPSMVPHPDQEGVEKGAQRFVMSLRATGEGHVSSLVFREGIIDAQGGIQIESPNGLLIGPDLVRNPMYEKEIFRSKLYEMGHDNKITEEVLHELDGEFTLDELKRQILRNKTAIRRQAANREHTLNVMVSLAEQQYEIHFDGDHRLSERVIFPRIDHNRKAIEDARFVRFEEANGEIVYYATYTAYDGRTFLPQLLKTKDFRKFKFITMNGAGVENKGMALFPKKIAGYYAMISRQDGENIYIMFSDHLHFWQEPHTLMKPTYSWEYVQLGNCGSPIETPEGWLVLTHGVGPMRRYCIGAVLLDLEDPRKLIGRMKEPLLEPDENEREGYVPNVVYTCGAMIHGDRLILPYAMSDYATRIASVDLEALLKKLKNSK